MSVSTLEPEQRRSATHSDSESTEDKTDPRARTEGERPAEKKHPQDQEGQDNRRANRKSDQEEDGKDEASDKEATNEQKRTRWPLIALGIFIIVGTIAALIYWLATKDQVTTDDAYTDGRAVLIAPHVSGYVKILAIDDNQFVHQGDLLVEIDPKDYIAARDQAEGQLNGIKAQLENARIALDKAKTLYPAQLTQAQGAVESAQGQLFKAERDHQRQNMLSNYATTQTDRDASTAGLKNAQGQLDQAQGQLRQAQLVAQNIAQAKARVEELEGQEKQAQGQFDQAEINLGYTRVVAPQSGWITRRNVEKGDYLQAGGQILAIVLPQVWVTANYKETEITRMRPGQRASIRVDAYPSLRLDGHVDSVQFGSGEKFSAFPPENATGNFIKIVQRVPVKIVIDKGLGQRQALPLGISVEPTVYFK